MKDRFSVKQLAKIAAVSVRTLHHYDDIGLLRPSFRTEKGYRYYDHTELLKLQQILIYKELGLPLADIAEILTDPAFDLQQALTAHKKTLQEKKRHLTDILKTIDQTLKQLNSKNKNMNYDDLYKGFKPEVAKAYVKEASERWGEDKVQESHNRIRKMGPEKFEELKAQAQRINSDLVLLLKKDPTEKRVQELIKEHYEMTGQYFDLNPEIYLCLGQMYVDDERFKKYYDKHDERLAEFLRDGIFYFCSKK